MDQGAGRFRNPGPQGALILNAVLLVRVVALLTALKLVQRTQKLGLAKVEIVDIRDFAEGSFRDVDDSPIGGGRGLILRAEPVRKAIAAARGKSEDSGSGTQVIALTPA